MSQRGGFKTLSLFLSGVLFLESPVLAISSFSALVGSTSGFAEENEDSLRDSFKKVKEFKDREEQPRDAESDADISEAAEELAELGRRSKVPLSEINEATAKAALDDLRNLTLSDQPKVVLEHHSASSVKVVIGKEASVLENQLSNIVQGLFVPGDERDIRIVVNANPLPVVTARDLKSEDPLSPGRYLELSVSIGAFAAVQNQDEMVALIAQALGTINPKSRNFHDDPRLYRRLNDQTDFESLDPEVRSAIQADISALERMRSLQVRPWALTDYELRTFTFFREKYGSKFSKVALFWPHYRLRNEKKNIEFKAQHDKYFELRILAQKVVISYMQERENIKDLVQTKHELNGPLLVVHQRAKAAVAPMFSLLAQAKIGAKYAAFVMGGAGLVWATVTGALWVAAKTSAIDFDAFLREHGWSENLIYQYARSLAVQGAEGVEWLNMEVWQPFAGKMGELWSRGLDLLAQGWHGTLNGAIWLGNQVLYGLSEGVTAVGSVLMYVGGKVGDGLTYTWSHLANATGQLWSGFEVIFRHFGHGVAEVWSYIEPVLFSPFVLVGAAVVGLIYLARNMKKPQAAAQWTGQKARAVGQGLATAGRWVGQFSRQQWNYAQSYFQETFRSSREVDAFLEGLSSNGATYEQLLLLARDLKILDETIYSWDRFGFSQSQQVFQRQSSNYLGSASLKRKKYWKTYAHFLEIFCEHINKGALTFEQVATILRTIDDRRESNFIQNNSRSDDKKDKTWTPLKTRLLEEEQTRPWLASLYQAVTQVYGLTSPAIQTGMIIEVLSPPELSNVQLVGLAHLMERYESLKGEFDGSLLLKIVQIVFEVLNMRWLAIDLVTEHWDAFIEYLFSDACSPADREKALKLFGNMKVRHTTAAVKGKDFWPELPKLMARFQSDRAKAGDWARVIAIETQMNVHRFWDEGAFRTVRRTLSGHSILAFRIDLHINGIFRSAQDLKDVLRHYDAFVRAGAATSGLTQRLYEMLLNRPDLLKSREDIEAVLDREYFWPQLNTNRARWTFVRRRPHILSNRGIDPVEEPIRQAIAAKMEMHPRSWQYEPVQAEKMHSFLIERLIELGEYPSDYEGLKNLWMQLSQRGVTAETDRLFQKLVDLAPQHDLEEIQRLAINDGRIWETNLHSQMAIALIKSSRTYMTLLESTDPRERETLLKSVIAELNRKMPEFGMAYVQFLEELSVQLTSSYEEAKLISSAKSQAARSRQSSSFGNLDEVFERLKKWPKKDQFNFLLVLRGDVEPDPIVAHHFRNVGIERVRRMYEVLPIAARVGILDTFFSHSLVGSGDSESRSWIRRLTKHIIGGENSESQKIAFQLLSAFLHAVDEVGNGNLTTTILSYLYALPATATASPGETLKHVLEVFGATGIKVGQFLLAAQILPPEESVILRSLQDRAKIPARMEMYEDVIDVLGVKEGAVLPFTILDLLGAASMKYAFLAEDTETAQKLVVKMFRLEAKNNVDMQFDVLASMSRYLVKSYGPKYGVLDVIIESARRAVDRERNAQHEIYKSYVARNSIYVRLNEQGIEVQAPREDLVSDRMIVAQFAEGQSFNEIPDKYKSLVARKILTMEADILFHEHGVIRFDPDRHAGNYLIHIHEDPSGSAQIKISPIDFGQVLRISPAQRDRVIRIFALAQIASKVGMNQWLLQEIQKVMSLTDEQTQRLNRNARRYIKAADFNPVTVYISLLAAVKASGFEELDISYIDFIRGVIQLTQYEPYADAEVVTPSDLFEMRVLNHVEEALGQMQLDPSQIRAIRAINAFRKFKGFFSNGNEELIPENLSKIDFSKFIRRDDRKPVAPDCESLLQKGA